jgi:hypothetical protein
MKYLARLKSETSLSKELPKLSKGQSEAFGSFGSDPSRHIFKNELPVLTSPLLKSLAICQSCNRLDLVEIMGADVPGCLYDAGGDYPDGWKRLPLDMKRCIIH